jgi:hypothetical protein
MSADKLVWKAAAALLLVATRALCAWLRVEPRLLGQAEDEVARLRRLGAV